ncbi:MAG: mechanosensitive ion channel family protein, partial [Muribaculaceae bacterium]|nr:mechanosensitive ion channel family protein [Muribaculaceae bacterium]
LQNTPAATDPATVDLPSVHEEIRSLSTMSFDELMNQLVSNCVKFAINLAIAILVFYIGKFIITRLYRFVGSIMLRRRVDPSLTTFVLSTIKIILYFILIVTVIGIIGIETSSFLALFASAGVAIGMALSGTLQNFAGGVLILLLKPYKVGDYIEAQGYAGTVSEIQIFHTLIATPDNKAIIIPNGGLSTSSVNNWSRRDYRRVSWTVSISYGDNVQAAREALLEIFASDQRVMQGRATDPAAPGADLATGGPKPEAVTSGKNGAGDAATAVPHVKTSPRKPGFFYRLFHNKRKVRDALERWKASRDASLSELVATIDYSPKVVVDQLADSSVNLSARAWVRTSDYWGVYYDLNERIYNELPVKAGISFPFPQMDIHVTSDTPSRLDSTFAS